MMNAQPNAGRDALRREELQTMVRDMAKTESAAQQLLEAFRVRDRETSIANAELLAVQNRTDEIRLAMRIEFFPTETLHARMLDAAKNVGKLVDRIRAMEHELSGMTHRLYIENCGMRAELKALREPRPFWRRALNVFFPIHTNNKGPQP